MAERAQRLASAQIQVRVCRAELLTLEGRRAEAADLYRAIAAQLPDDSDFRRACALKAETLGR